MGRPAGGIAWALLGALVVCGCAAPARMVYVTRHAEKEAGRDPPLSAQGRARAAALADHLAGSDVRVVLVTQYRRTRETAEPLAQRLGVPVRVMEVSADVEGHAAEVARACREMRGGSVLVVGHSNTVPAIVGALTGEPIGAIPEDRYGDVWVVRMDGRGRGRVVAVEAVPAAAGAPGGPGGER